MIRASWVTCALALALFLSGCFKVGPDYLRPEEVAPEAGSFQHAPEAVAEVMLPDRWWESFRDERLNEVVEEAVKNNLDIREAAERVLEVRSLVKSARADRWPKLDGEAGFTRQRRTITTPGQTPGAPAVSKGTTYNTFSVSLPASFEVDLWGRLSRAEEAQRAELFRAEENRLTLVHTVIAEAVGAYLEIEALERRIDITEKSVKSYQRTLTVVESRYERGLTNILEVRQARRALAQAETSLPELRQELGLAQQRLAVLLGRYPKTGPPRRQPEDYYKRIEPVPPGLPSELLERRPDIRAAEAELMALNARVGAARAARFPRISLTGSFGYTSDEMNTLLKPESEIWSLAAGLVMPLFNMGKLEAQEKAARARYRQGVTRYARTVLNAFREVESALLTRKEQLERRQRLLKFLGEARATQEVAESRYMRGLIDYLDVLEAQRTRYSAEESLVLVDLSLLTNRVTLHRALGGGWGEEVLKNAQDNEKTAPDKS